ncbi:LemA family protein [Xenophilus sp. AP218F]|nr:LemA family protein [Chromobacterium sp. ASV5]OWY38732.1 LemA family protein [Xenophilus sp. AP218F]
MKLVIFLAIAGAAALYLITLFNALVDIKHQVGKCWANIDVLLKQRHDEIPKLVAACQQYARFEQGMLDKMMQARQAVAESALNRDMPGLGQAESRLRSLFGQVYAAAEAYPELKADQQFAALSQRITQLEESLADRRELYNEAVNINNARIEQFPDVLLARLFNMQPAQSLSFSAAETGDVDVAALFKQS